MSNIITLFSNGIGHFSRTYKVAAGEPTKLSVPFKREHIGDVAASLQVFGKVKLSSPPSFTPANSDSTHLTIDQGNAMRSLMKALGGAKVRVGLSSKPEKAEYTLVGVEQDTKQVGDMVAKTDVLVVMDDSLGCVKRIAFCDLCGVDFVEEAVRQEIGKALKKNFQQIKPDSTFLDLVLESLNEEGVEATVQYTIPVAAWKMRYSIREEEGKFFLDGAAVVDNNTDEDWLDSIISVVTGNPISFNTDIATVVTPVRKTINLVNRDVLGNVDVMDGELESVGGFESARKGVRARGSMAYAACAPMGGGMGPKSSVSNYADFGMEEGIVAQCAGVGDMAQSAGADSKEVGDFSIFTSKQPVTILARKSAVVPMFVIPLSTAGSVLYYKEANHAKRPYRAVKFKNEATYTLNRGKTTIYNGGIFSGECVLDTTKPGENRTLPHCLENGVKVNKVDKGHESVVSVLSFGNGSVVQETVQTSRVEYTLTNKKDETFKIHIEHLCVLGDNKNTVTFDGVELAEVEKIDGGRRMYFKLEPNSAVTLAVNERHVHTDKFSIGNNWNWIWGHVSGKSISSDPVIQECFKLNEEINKLQRDIGDKNNRVDELEQQAERVRNNLTAAKDVSGSEMVGEWVRDLDSTEKEIREIERNQVPALQQNVRALQEKLAAKIQSISVSWNNTEVPKQPTE